jgi:hypothetical protein
MDTGILTESRERFFFWVAQCHNNYRHGHDLELYREIVQLHRQTGSLDLILQDNGFHRLIWSTLEAWNMNQKGARLVSQEDLKNSLVVHRNALLQLYQYKLDRLSQHEIEHDVRGLLWVVFNGLKVMKSERRIVGVSKALHFLLPDLVMPIDSTYTMMFFYGYNKYSRDAKIEFQTFMKVFMENWRIANKLGLSQRDVTREGWNTSVPKLIDNAIIGLFKYIEHDFKEHRQPSSELGDRSDWI